MSDQDDKELVRRCLEGDRRAFEFLVGQYQTTLFNVALRMTHSAADAEDIAQTSFLKAYEKLDSFNPKYKFFSWLYRIAVNEALNFLGQQKQTEQLDEDMIGAGDVPEEESREAEVAKVVENALMDLKVDHRIVIVLKHLQGLSYSEIGQILDISEKKVKSRLFTARLVLKDVLQKKGLGRHD